MIWIILSWPFFEITEKSRNFEVIFGVIFSQLLEITFIWTYKKTRISQDVIKHFGKFLDQTDENFFLWANTFFGTYIEDIG